MIHYHFPRFRAPVALLVSLLVLLATWLGGGSPVGAQPLVTGPLATRSIVTTPVLAALFSFAGSRPANLGFQASGFAACPSTPNCVSSLATDADHAIAPLHFSTDPVTAFNHLKTTIKSAPNAAIITESDDYLYAEYTSALMGFVDDVEFHLDPAAQVIQVRSASRLGESDLGVNRKRIEALQAAF
jgi:uncharacterized protein (DUF1499 family)